MFNGKKHIKIVRHQTHSPGWHKFRENGVGGSEVGGVLGYSKYSPAIYLYHSKVGDFPARVQDNQPMFHGRQMEDYVARCWAAYAGTEESLFANFGNVKIRSPRKVTGYIVNEKYPRLFASPDRLFGGFRIDTSEEIELGILECKTISHWESQKWEAGVPPSYIFQVQQYMLVLELDYAELACLKNGNEFIVYPIERNEKMCQMILEGVEDFWNRVAPAQEAWKKYVAGQCTREYAEIIIQKYEPEPDGSEIAEQLLSERYRKVIEESAANEIDEDSVAKLREIKSAQKELSEKRDELENYFRQRFVSERSEKLLLNDGTYVRASKRANANKLTITV